MKVLDVMQKHVDFVDSDTSIRDLSRIIFGRGINGVPVCKDKKVVGFITERDILAKFYPSMQEYIEDPFRSSDFEVMEDKINEILEMTVDKIMTKNPTVVESDTPLLKAQSIMFIRKIGRLPVVDASGNLIGIISKGDIFKSIVGKNLPLQDEEGFYDWSAKLYDIMMDWNARLSHEIPDVEALLKKEKVKKVLDVASSTGEHVISLAKKGFEVTGVEASSLMGKIAHSKRNTSSKEVKSKVSLFEGKYSDTLKKVKSPIDAALFMGNTLPHVCYTDKDILSNVVKVLGKEKSLMVFQIINFNKVLNSKNGLRDFTIKEEKKGSYYKFHAFLGFYVKKDKDTVIYTRAVFSSIGEGRWSFVSMNSTPIEEITKDKLGKMLRKLGFSNISFYGSSFDGPIFKEAFNKIRSDWLNVVAVR